MANFSRRADLLLAAADAVRGARPVRPARPALPPAVPAATRHAIADLRRSHDELTRKVEALQSQANTKLLDLLQEFRAVKAQNRLMRIEAKSVKALAVRRAKELAVVKVNERVQAFASAATTMQTAAYGHKGTVWHKNNLLLAGNQLAWTFADPLLRRAGFLRGPSPSLLSVLAPVGMLLTGEIALGGDQHVRFVSGVATMPVGRNEVPVLLRTRIADRLWPAFEQRTDVPVTVVSLEPGDDVTYVGVVRRGMLLIGTEDMKAQAARLAWMVDTGADIG